ncbi:hypothetical protein MNBD_GAMMA02-1199 [hydrothermal vent metagenome]|uniref:Uncharacterized protein n=1 Tax=hydrothermal vent metagenome TaxID=652676 RepID=A0A3B0WN14_9ZZZZ
MLSITLVLITTVYTVTSQGSPKLYVNSNGSNVLEFEVAMSNLSVLAGA